jgi:hypothetical protein
VLFGRKVPTPPVVVGSVDKSGPAAVLLSTLNQIGIWLQIRIRYVSLVKFVVAKVPLPSHVKF